MPCEGDHRGGRAVRSADITDSGTMLLHICAFEDLNGHTVRCWPAATAITPALADNVQHISTEDKSHCVEPSCLHVHYELACAAVVADMSMRALLINGNSCSCS
jgi:hypothetical protein